MSSNSIFNLSMFLSLCFLIIFSQTESLTTAEMNNPISAYQVNSRFQSTGVVDAIIAVDVHSFDASIDSIRLSASFDYFNSEGLLRDFDASSKESVTNFQYTWDGSGNCWDTSDVSFECDGVITRLVVSYDYTQKITSTPFTVGAGLNVPTAIINGDVTINYADFAHFASTTLAPTIESPGQLQWVGSGQDAYGAFANFWACNTPNFQEGDMDGDALQDEWEICGYAKDGTVANLPAMGANPKHKDIFIEIDSMIGQDGDPDAYKPNPEALRRVIEAFNNAPIPANDGDPNNGKMGIHLHIDHGDNAPLKGWDPLSAETWGNLSRSDNDITFSNTLNVCPLWSSRWYDWSEFDIIKADKFESARLPIFHYVLWVHNTCPQKNLLGLARVNSLNWGAGGSDFIISLGVLEHDFKEIHMQSGAFMHELGHNLGLQHGGHDDVTGKPNYLSVMNHLYARGLHTNGALDFDYSRFALLTLNETSLDEDVGVAIPDGRVYEMFWLCRQSSAPLLASDYRSSLNNFPIDWNCDKEIEQNIQANINGDYEEGEAIFSNLEGHDDWNAIVFDGGIIGELSIDGDELPSMTQIDEFTIEELELVPTFYTVYLPVVASP